MKPKLLLLSVPFLGLLAACGATAATGPGAGGGAAPSSYAVNQGSTAGTAGSAAGLAAAPATKAVTNSDQAAAPPAGQANVPPLPSAQHLEINETLSIQIPRNKFQDDYAQILGIVTGQRGYLSASDTNTDGPRTGTFTFQVPVDNYTAVVNQLHGIGKYSEHLTSRPHDAEYVDQQARLKSAQAQLAALNGLLTKASSIGDIIAIEQQIAPVQQQIEEYQGQLRYLDSLTQYATVTVILTEKGAAPAPKPVPPGFADSFRQVLRNLAAMANAFILVVGTLLPFLLIAVVAFATRRRWMPVFVRT